MYFFRPPKSKESWPFVAFAILGHSLSFHVFRAYLLLNMHIRFQQSDDQLQNITYLFDLIYYTFLGLGAILLQMIMNKFGTILLLMALTVVAQFIFFMSDIVYLTQAAFLVVAGFSSTITIGLLAYGAAEYIGVNCLQLLSYFAINYIVEIIGYLMALRFVKMNMLIENMCGRFTCVSYVTIVSLFFEIFAWIAFSFCDSSGTKISNKPISSEIIKLGRILTVFIPFLIVFFDYGDGIWRWVAQARFMKCQFLWYKLSINDMLTVDLVAVILCGLVFHLFTYCKYVARCPAVIIGLGGCLMAAAIILSSYNYAIVKEYDEPKLLTNTSRIYIGGNCNVTGKRFVVANCSSVFQMNSTSIYFGDINLKSLNWNLNGKKSCYKIHINYTIYYTDKDIRSFSKNQSACLREKTSYIFSTYCIQDEIGVVNVNFTPMLFDDRRNIYGHPKLCIVSSVDAMGKNYPIKFQSVMNLDARYVSMIKQNFICRTIIAGEYDLYINRFKLARNLNFRYGGVYLAHITEEKTYQIIVIRPSFDVPLWYLLIIIYMAALGKNCVIATGFYVFYTQSPINVRTIAIGSWYLYISSGSFVFTISGATGLPEQMTSFMVTGELIGVMSFIYLILYMCYGQWNYKCDAEPTVDDSVNETIEEANEEPPLPPPSVKPSPTKPLLPIIQQSPPPPPPSPPLPIKPPKKVSHKAVLTVEYHHKKN